jgi:hypothetical protein
MDTTAADIRRWARGQESAGLRTAREERTGTMPFLEALARVDDLRDIADAMGATVDPRRSAEDNLAFHLIWARVRRAWGIG